MNKSFFIIAGSLTLLLSVSLFWAFTKNSTPQDTKKNQPANLKSSVVELTAESGPSLIAHAPLILIVDFYTEWCGPCKAIKPIFEELATEFKNKYLFAKVNVDHCKELAQEFKIVSIPTIIIFSNGKVIDKITGMVSKETLLEKIEQALKGPQDLSTLSPEILSDKLIQAIQNASSPQDIKQIIDAGADVNKAAANGISPLMLAIILNGTRGSDASELITVLLNAGASCEFADEQTGQKTQALEFVQMMSQNCRRMADNYDKIAIIFEAHKTKSKECTEGSCSL